MGDGVSILVWSILSYLKSRLSNYQFQVDVQRGHRQFFLVSSMGPGRCFLRALTVLNPVRIASLREVRSQGPPTRIKPAPLKLMADFCIQRSRFIYSLMGAWTLVHRVYIKYQLFFSRRLRATLGCYTAEEHFFIIPLTILPAGYLTGHILMFNTGACTALPPCT